MATIARVTGAALLLAGVLVRPAVLNAHHEAIFGPQSSLILSANNFVSVQVFSRVAGTSDSKSRETTGLVSTGLRVTRRLPLTFTAILPYSWISTSAHSATSGAEDVVLGLRYRHDLKGLQAKWDREGNFLMGMGAFELNNGTIDHRAWSGPLDSLAAALGSLEWGPWSAIGYTLGRVNVEDSARNKDGNIVSVGGGVAYTPDEDFQTGRLFSYQVGWSFEHRGRDRVDGQPGSDTGGNELFLHPTFVYSPGHDLLLFGMVSVPVRREFEDPASQDGYRFGTGVLYGW
jgi:hypothetical protein